MNLKRYTIIYGHYGSGKTNFSINMALDKAREGKKVTIVDLDIVNPYFRTSDYKELLEQNNIHVISPNFANTTVDIPSLPTEIYSVFDSSKSDYIILDVGGDDAGAYALGRFAPYVNKLDNCDILYVVNKYRAITQTAAGAVEILREIETASHIKATGIINNSHLQQYTTEQTIIDSLPYAKEVSEALNLPLVGTTAPKSIFNKVENAVENIIPVEIYVKPPF